MLRASLALLQFPAASSFACRHISFWELRLWDCRFKQVLLFLSYSLFSTTGCHLPQLQEGLVKTSIYCYFIPSFSHLVSPSANHTANSGLFLQIKGASTPHRLGQSAFCLEWVTLASAEIGMVVTLYDLSVKAPWRSLKLTSISFLAKNKGSEYVC